MKGRYKTAFSEVFSISSLGSRLKFASRGKCDIGDGFNGIRALQSNIGPGLSIHTARKPGRARHKCAPNLVAKLT